MLRMLRNIGKAAVSIAIAPAALLADLATLPCTAYDDRPPFERTAATLRRARKCIDAATAPEREARP